MPQKKVILPILRINGAIVECVDKFVFLGIKINKHLHWSHHNTDVANKIVKTVGTKYIENIFAPKQITYNWQLTNITKPKLWYPIMGTPRKTN